jgi:hypothetical protein
MLLAKHEAWNTHESIELVVRCQHIDHPTAEGPSILLFLR